MTGSENWQQMRRQLAPEEILRPQAVDLRRLVLILLVALIHGLIYLFLVPPWQHYDEPNHFEYVWLVANKSAEWERLPQPGDFHWRLSYRVIESMQQHGFYDRQPVTPEMPPFEPSELRIPGYSQLSEPPLYYLLASIPGRVFRPLAVQRQLYAARLVSLLLYLLTVVAGWGVARELTLPGHPLRWLLPSVLALTPGLAELMTAVNNDALAIAVFSFFMWGSVRLLVRGPDLLTLLWVIAAAGLTWFSKNTAWIALPLLGIVLLFSVFRGRMRPVAWLLLFIMLVAGFVSVLLADDAAAWYRIEQQAAGLRRPLAELTPDPGSSLPPGSYALALEAVSDPQSSNAVYQVLPPQTARALFDQTITFGVWMWAEQPVQARTPRLVAAGQTFSETVSLTTTPQFFAFQAQLPAGFDRIWVYLAPTPPDAGWIAYDGMVLAPGEQRVDLAPQLTDPQGRSGVWDEQPFENRLRNPSFELAGLRLRPQIDRIASRYLPDNALPSQLLASLLDPGGAGYFYRLTAIHLFQTFWARFGWGHVPLVWGWAYWLPGLITLLALIGCVIGWLRSEDPMPGDVIAIAALAMLAASAFALMRGAQYLWFSHYYYSTARHLYPAALPFALVLSAGWLGLPGRGLRLALLLLLAALILLSVASIAMFYGII